MARTMTKRDGLSWRALWRMVLVGAALFALAAIAAAISGPRAPVVPAAPVVTGSDAAVMCHTFVEDRLRAPSTASWAWPSEDRITRDGDGVFTVRSYVDAQNDFGAQIRTRYTCVVQPPTAERKTWRLVSLDLP
jgi:hypothetical protein